jgi:hypothetical protein
VLLCQHPDFRQLVILAANALRTPEQFIEKDYYLTEALRLVAESFPTQVIFKGGTSLSKGWALISRFSEDIDLFLNPRRFDPPLTGKHRIDRALRAVRDVVASHPGLTYRERRGSTIGGLGRADEFTYDTQFDGLPVLRPSLLLEVGIQSGEQPVETVRLSSHLANFLVSRGQGNLADDTGPFSMTLLHFRRTFVEKTFAIHSKVVAAIQAGNMTTLGRNMRHYADLHVLARRPEVRAMLESDEYGEIARDYDARSREFFPRSHFPPDGLRFTNSEALFPPDKLRAQLQVQYDRECPQLFIPREACPSFADVLAAISEIRALL